MIEWGRKRKDQLPTGERAKHVSPQQRRFVVLLTWTWTKQDPGLHGCTGLTLTSGRVSGGRAREAPGLPVPSAGGGAAQPPPPCLPLPPVTLGNAQLHLEVHRGGDNGLGEHQHVLQPDDHHQVGEDLPGDRAGLGEEGAEGAPNTQLLLSRPGSWGPVGSGPQWGLPSNSHITGLEPHPPGGLCLHGSQLSGRLPSRAEEPATILLSICLAPWEEAPTAQLPEHSSLALSTPHHQPEEPLPQHARPGHQD